MDGEPTAESASSTPTAESTPPPPSQPEIAPAAPTSASEDGPGWALWLAALVAALAVAGGLFAFLRRRANAPAPAIERPLTRPVEPTPAPTPEAAPAPAPAPPLSLGETPISPAPISPARLSSPTPSPGAPLSLSAQPVRFSRTMMNATFACRIVLENRGGSAWEDIVVEADLVTAHGAVPIGDQLADPATPLASVHDVAALPAGESMELATDVRLPLQQVRPIRQGSAAVYVPLLRLRVVTPGMAPVAQTYLIGQLPDRPGGRLRPFRLDEIPQVYQAIGIRALGDQA
ncbi:hypothetical protein AM2010_1260 [Pelagerythrobacter marensis]|uniref:Uncharacterized protein n=2 Tax=Pelagerythrobacter marensis TaxID=543877 RepID=A0A0G3X9P5_9SPHN|nr:hypothetical protein AM2010_1260 [Pelagerythrobacter marensis]